MGYKKRSAGFTVVEVVVAIVILTLFLGVFLRFFVALTSQRVAVNRQALANDIAYSNLRKFTTRPSVVCDSSLMDLTANPNAAGKLVGDESHQTPNSYAFAAEPLTTTQALGSSGQVHQTVLAFAPKGCSSPAYEDNPLLLRSIVTYGTNGEKAIHATFLN